MNGKVLKDVIHKKGMTYEEAAKKLGLSKPTIHKIIATGITSIHTLELIARTFKVHPGVFFDGEFLSYEEYRIKALEEKIRYLQEIIDLQKRVLKKESQRKKG